MHRQVLWDIALGICKQTLDDARLLGLAIRAQEKEIFERIKFRYTFESEKLSILKELNELLAWTRGSQYGSIMVILDQDEEAFRLRLEDAIGIKRIGEEKALFIPPRLQSRPLSVSRSRNWRAMRHKLCRRATVFPAPPGLLSGKRRQRKKKRKRA